MLLKSIKKQGLMKLIIVAALLLTFYFNSLSVGAQNLNVQNIIDSSAKYHNYKLLSNQLDIKISGSSSDVLPNKGSFEFYSMSPNLNRLDISVNNFRTSIIKNQKVGWVKPKIMPPTPLDSFNLALLNIFNYCLYLQQVFNIEENEFTLNEVDVEISGNKCFRLIDKNSREIYISKNDFCILKIIDYKQIGNDIEQIEYLYSSYRDFGGFKLPTEATVFIGMKQFRYLLENVDYNVGLTENDFRIFN